MSDSSQKNDQTLLNLKGRNQLPLVVLRDAVVFPGTSLPLIVQRPKSLAAIDAAMKSKHPLAMFVAQKDDESTNPGVLYALVPQTSSRLPHISKQKLKFLRPRFQKKPNAPKCSCIHASTNSANASPSAHPFHLILFF